MNEKKNIPKIPEHKSFRLNAIFQRKNNKIATIAHNSTTTNNHTFFLMLILLDIRYSGGWASAIEY
jgi:hypothetical protein